MPASMSRSATSARKSSSVNSPTHGMAPRVVQRAVEQALGQQHRRGRRNVRPVAAAGDEMPVDALGARRAWSLPSSVTSMPPRSEPRNPSARLTASSGRASRSGCARARRAPARTAPTAPDGTRRPRGRHTRSTRFEARIAPREQVEVGRVALADPAPRPGPAARRAAGPASRSTRRRRIALRRTIGRPSVPRIDCVVASPGSKLLPGEMMVVTASSVRELRRHERPPPRRTAPAPCWRRSPPARRRACASASSAEMPVTKPRASARSM